MNVAEQIKMIPVQDDRNVCSVIHNYYKVALLSQLKALSFSTPFSLPLYSDMRLAAINWNQCREQQEIATISVLCNSSAFTNECNSWRKSVVYLECSDF